jgi:hypothetical protein
MRCVRITPPECSALCHQAFANSTASSCQPPVLRRVANCAAPESCSVVYILTQRWWVDGSVRYAARLHRIRSPSQPVIQQIGDRLSDIAHACSIGVCTAGSPPNVSLILTGQLAYTGFPPCRAPTGHAGVLCSLLLVGRQNKAKKATGYRTAHVCATLVHNHGF